MFVFSLFTSSNATSLGEAQIGQHITPFNIMVRFVTVCTITYLLLDRVALGAERPGHQTFPWTTCRSARRSVQCIVENGGSDIDAVWHRRSDGSMDEAGSGCLLYTSDAADE